MKIALSGASGNLGKVIRPELLRQGVELRSAGGHKCPEPFAANEDVMCGDLRDPLVVDRLLKGVDILLHFAGSSVEGPLAGIIDNNLTALAAIYEGVRRHHVKRVVFASSNHAIGMYPVDEKLDIHCAVRPDGFYGLSKVWGEALARMYWDKHGVETICIRIGSCIPKPTEVRHLSTWLSEDDLLRLLSCCITAEEVGFCIVWGVSDNSRTYWDNSAAERLGFHAQDNAEQYAAEITALASRTLTENPQYQGGSFALMNYTPPGERGKTSRSG